MSAQGKTQFAATSGDKLRRIEDAIESSREILELKDDWDGEGGQGYLKETWQRAASFVRNYARRLWSEHEVLIPAPKILPGPNGSIDVHWEEKDFELLVNISADREEKAEFYGDDYGSIYIKGKLNPSTFNRGLIEWLQKAS